MVGAFYRPGVLLSVPFSEIAIWMAPYRFTPNIKTKSSLETSEQFQQGDPLSDHAGRYCLQLISTFYTTGLRHFPPQESTLLRMVRCTRGAMRAQPILMGLIRLGMSNRSRFQWCSRKAFMEIDELVPGALSSLACPSKRDHVGMTQLLLRHDPDGRISRLRIFPSIPFSAKSRCRRYSVEIKTGDKSPVAPANHIRISDGCRTTRTQT